ncbi:hypothetical protein [Nonomuraea sp. bgisy101]|uniref:hypothetical protein n=1 Tax=Nonomuraea sp. bgisy101 TaxID=3413784 RepID=UPI003D715528
MATRPAQVIGVEGSTPVYHSATATTGDKVKPGPRTFITVKNAGGVSTQVVLSGVGKTSYQEDLPDKDYTVPTAGEMDIPIKPEFANPDDGGLATFVCTPAASVTFAVRQI